MLTLHDQAGTCIHGEPHYGTRSSVILRLAGEPSASELYVADTRPCLGQHEDRSALLGELSRASSPEPGVDGAPRLGQ